MAAAAPLTLTTASMAAAPACGAVPHGLPTAAAWAAAVAAAAAAQPFLPAPANSPLAALQLQLGSAAAAERATLMGVAGTAWAPHGKGAQPELPAALAPAADAAQLQQQLRLAVVLRLGGKLAEALKVVDHVVAQQPTNLGAVLLRAQIQEAGGNVPGVSARAGALALR